MNTFNRISKSYSAAKGFTMVELLIVVVMIGLLSIVGMTAYTASLRTGRDARRKADLEQIRSGLELYMSDDSTYPADLSDLEIHPITGKKYITLPKDPSSGLDYYYSPSGARCPAECDDGVSCSPVGSICVSDGSTCALICDTYSLGTALEGAPPSASCGLGSVCSDLHTGAPVDCDYCLDPYGEI